MLDDDNDLVRVPASFLVIVKQELLPKLFHVSIQDRADPIRKTKLYNYSLMNYSMRYSDIGMIMIRDFFNYLDNNFSSDFPANEIARMIKQL